MFLSAVILILQEILEAAILVSVLLSLARVLRDIDPGRRTVSESWVFWGIGAGIVGAFLFAWSMPVVSTWFDYVGYEVSNAMLQALTVVLLLLFCRMPPATRTAKSRCLSALSVIGMIVFGIVREGSEIILYMNGLLGQPDNASPAFLGLLMAVGIGVSCSVMLYFGLSLLSVSSRFRAAIVLLGLFAANMAAQCISLLTQADWLPFTSQAWDSSFLVSEQSITGHILYPLIGYEANPSWSQVGGYLLVLLLALSSPLARRAWRGGGSVDS